MKNNCLEFTGTAEDFVVNEEKFENNRLISQVGRNFKNSFYGKVEKPIPKTTLSYQDLIDEMEDDVIIETVGGRRKAIITLREIIFIMEFHQKNGNENILLSQRTNIFYVKDKNNVLKPVWLTKNHKGYNIDSFKRDKIPWGKGCRVFFKNGKNFRKIKAI